MGWTSGIGGSRRACANVALVLMSFIVGLMFSELGLRTIDYPNPNDFQKPPTGMYPRFYHVADPVNGHDISKNFSGGVHLLPDYIHTHGAPFPVSSNRLGCRDRSFDSLEEGYVLLLGDSFTWGYVPLEQTWGAILEQLIGMRVLNCGVAGYGPRQERHKLKNVVVHAGQPNFVIVGHVMNDLVDDYLYPQRTVIDGYMVNKVILADATRGARTVRSEEDLQKRLKKVLEPQPIGLIHRANDLLEHHSITYSLVRNAEVLQRVVPHGIGRPPPTPKEVEAYRSVAEFPWLERAWEEHLENLRQLRLTVEESGATAFFVIFPDAGQVYDTLRPQESNLHWEYPNQRLADFFQRENIPFVDLLPEFRRYAHCDGGSTLNPERSLYWAHDGHPNVRGNRLAGLLISRHVLERSLVDSHDKDRRLSDIERLLTDESRCH